MANMIKVLPTTTFDYSSLGNSASSEVTHGGLINTLHAKELIVLPRISARVSGTGTITVIVRVVFAADDDASEVVGADLISQTISSGSPPNAFVGRVAGGLPEWVRVLTLFTQPASAGSLLCRHSINLILNDS